MKIKDQLSFVAKCLYGTVLFAAILGGAGMNAQNVHAENLSGDIGLNRATVQLSFDHESFGSEMDVLAHLEITNPGDESIRILKWLTPIAGMEGSLFTVARDGVLVDYLGRVTKRATPTENDYVTLMPGESISSDVTLTDYYDFSRSGHYSIKYNVASAVLFAKTDGTSYLASNESKLFVEGRTTRLLKGITPNTLNKSESFLGCNGSQQADIVAARNVASSYSANAVSYFNAAKQGSRYTTWFGIYDASRYATVASHYNSIQYVMDNADMSFDCTCTQPGVYAYVYSNDPYNIHLCPVFWSSPTSGTDSKAGTLIHEVSHFTVVAGTDDFAYGQNPAQSLAISNPSWAIQNADSHEYFAENTPVLETVAYTFGDVPDTAFAWSQIESIYSAGITGGCNTSPLLYCPNNTVTRAQMAVFLLRGIYSPSYSPPAAVGTVFNDVPVSTFAASWIEQLAIEGITGGCGNNNYCPDGTVTRDQMAVFLLRAKHGASYVPPAVGGDTGFDDVPVDYWAAAWIKQLAAETITGGCGAENYCPNDPVTRAQMAIFLQRTFSLP